MGLASANPIEVERNYMANHNQSKVFQCTLCKAKARHTVTGIRPYCECGNYMVRLDTRGMTVEDRFLVYVVKGENSDDCWSWLGVDDNYQRGAFRMPGRSSKTKAHHAAYMIFKGPRPEGKEAHHTCLNKTCVNPDHIQWLTKSEHRAEHRRLKNAQA
jgi:hypothetical protein